MIFKQRKGLIDWIRSIKPDMRTLIVLLENGEYTLKLFFLPESTQKVQEVSTTKVGVSLLERDSSQADRMSCVNTQGSYYLANKLQQTSP